MGGGEPAAGIGPGVAARSGGADAAGALGNCTCLWQLGHLPTLPAIWSGTFNFAPQLGQITWIGMALPRFRKGLMTGSAATATIGHSIISTFIVGHAQSS